MKRLLGTLICNEEIQSWEKAQRLMGLQAVNYIVNVPRTRQHLKNQNMTNPNLTHVRHLYRMKAMDSLLGHTGEIWGMLM